MSEAASIPGRRERNKQDKLARILAAGAELFDAYGYSAVTTQQVAQRAGIGTGTLFEYVATKAELLMMVQNRRFAASVDEGWQAQAAQEGLGRRLRALIEPVVACNRTHAENGRAYLQEILYGSPDDRFRAEAIAVTDRLRAHIEAVVAAGEQASAAEVSGRARVVFAVVFLEMSSWAQRAASTQEVLDEISRQLAASLPGW